MWLIKIPFMDWLFLHKVLSAFLRYCQSALLRHYLCALLHFKVLKGILRYCIVLFKVLLTCLIKSLKQKIFIIGVLSVHLLRYSLCTLLRNHLCTFLGTVFSFLRYCLSVLLFMCFITF
jgi:hypothetical protein